MSNSKFVGQRFGNLTIIAFSHHNHSDHWKAKCICGRVIIRTTTQLTHLKSCGCRWLDGFHVARAKRTRNLLGKRFGKLIVIDFWKVMDHFSYWVCRCDCGKSHVIRANNLLRKDGVKSCGCLRDEKTKERRRIVVDATIEKLTHEYVGASFGRWTVLEIMRSEPRNGLIALCQCACGTQRSIQWIKLPMGLSKSCGCGKKTQTKELVYYE